MPFSYEKLTTKSQEALTAAQESAIKSGNPELTALHLLAALLGESEGNVRPILEAAGGNFPQILQMADADLRQLPKMSGSNAAPQPDGDLQRVLFAATDEAEAMKDDYISTEHLLLALEKIPSKAKNILTLNALGREEFLRGIQKIRGGAKVADVDPESKLQALARYGIDFVALAKRGKLDPVFGRDSEIRRVIQVLSRRTKNNPVLIGEPGVGKTAIVE